MKRGLLLFFSWLLSLGVASALERVPQGLFLSPQGAHLRETLRLFPEEWKGVTLWFPARFKEEDFRVLRKPEDCRIVWEPLGAGPPAGPVAEKLAALEKEIGEVRGELAALSLAKKHLEGLRRLPGERAGEFLEDLSVRYREILKKERSLKEHLSKLHLQETRLRRALSPKEFSYFRLQASCERPRPLELLVEYPVEGVRFARERELRVLPGQGQLIVRDFLRLKETLGIPLEGLEVVWETFPQGIEIFEPPPFTPWWVDGPQFRTLVQAGRKAEALPSGPEPVPFGKIYRLSGLSLRPGIPEIFPLEERKLSGEFRVEVPAYFRPRAYLAVSFKPGTYLPAARTRIFLGETLLSQRPFPDLKPGKDYTFYLGTDPWVKVEEEVLKDYEETVGVVRKTRRRTRVWQIILDYHHQQGLPVTLYERVPVSHRKEIRVEVKAEPPWEELSPEGRARWRFHLQNGERKTIRLEAVVESPAS
ncbi:DUF4139 domain-containing protein [Thermosulfurimonas marina]|uniref:DUF4139 domain-containing protein n=1 Tax=Thermosulfurimonas marina TaxID=2047767 RepID=A0A6H1WTG0_9BACT|nr:DUF4139 domain-containing protein [Thermosulfurimonas marina]QJA06497.1 DUF4139 domain-containing protein [Thermosulfurimonas marina]